MEVSIEINESQTLPYREEQQKGLFGITVTKKIAQTVRPIWNVHLILIPTEEERATLFKYKIHEQWIEKIPLYSSDEIDAAFEAWGTALKRKRSTEELLQSLQSVWETKKEAERAVAIEEYFNNPYIRPFDHIQEAHTYTDKLKEEILPQIISLVRNFAGRTEKISFSL